MNMLYTRSMQTDKRANIAMDATDERLIVELKKLLGVDRSTLYRLALRSFGEAKGIPVVTKEADDEKA